MHVGASGKVLAAHLEADERERLLAAAGDPALSAVLDAIRERGSATTTGEIDPGVTAVAAPVLDVRGRLLAGLSLAGPSQRVEACGLERARHAVCDAARAIEAAIEARDRGRG